MAEEQPTVDGQQTPPPQTQPQTQSQQSNPPSAGSGPSSQDGPLQRLETAMAAMPEQIANAVREAFPKQPQQRQTPPPAKQTGTQGSGGQSSAPQETAKDAPGNKGTASRQERFHKWWFEG